MHEFRAKDERKEEVGEGLSPAQVALDQAAHLMDAIAMSKSHTCIAPIIDTKHNFCIHHIYFHVDRCYSGRLGSRESSRRREVCGGRLSGNSRVHFVLI